MPAHIQRSPSDPSYNREVERNIDEAARLPAYPKAALPDPAASVDYLIIVTDESGGRVPAFSDGAAWRRVTDRAVVS